MLKWPACCLSWSLDQRSEKRWFPKITGPGENTVTFSLQRRSCAAWWSDKPHTLSYYMLTRTKVVDKNIKLINLIFQQYANCMQCVCVCVCVCLCMCTCMPAYIHVPSVSYVHVHVYVCVSVRMCLQIACSYVCVCTHSAFNETVNLLKKISPQILAFPTDSCWWRWWTASNTMLK